MNNERIEKKFVLGKFKEDYLVKFLILNGFTKQFPNREINSVYLDTFGYDFAKDNINGVSHRKKLDFVGIMMMIQTYLLKKKIKKIS